jgi:protein-tyrosine phosphatase
VSSVTLWLIGFFPRRNSMPDKKIGRIDVHSHLLPGIDDGCPSLEESLACARRLVQAGYTHSFCTPHIWPNLPNNTVSAISRNTAQLQQALTDAGVPLRLIPGGELNLRPDTIQIPPDQVPTYGMARQFCLFDIWADRIPPFFYPAVESLQSMGLKVILAHPERMRAVQNNPNLADDFAHAGLLLQGNLQCLGDPPHSDTRQIIEKFLQERRYFMLGSDLHNLAGLPIRLQGLERAIELMGDEEVWRLTRDNPRQLAPDVFGD